MGGDRREDGMYFFPEPMPFTMADETRLSFHSSWDWLMPVVNKCTQVGFRDQKSENVYTEKWDELIADDVGKFVGAHIDEVWKACIDFIRWYNDQGAGPKPARPTEHAQIAKDLLVCALEGGSNYWMAKFKFGDIEDPTKPAYDYEAGLEAFGAGGARIIVDEIAGNAYSADLESFLVAVERHVTESSYASIEELWDSHDADDADQILQYACFGEIIYG